jgi:hypothetical protein
MRALIVIVIMFSHRRNIANETGGVYWKKASIVIVSVKRDREILPSTSTIHEHEN